MIRIDENTYIDNTLVTCAEYQLFIDEMREQGKYYQPDHWTSYQFPTGYAKKSILGVRQSDVDAFCDWLAKKENGEWQYRLPTKEESSQFPVEAHVEIPHGYWMMGDNQFIWIGHAPQVAYMLDIDKYRNHTLSFYYNNGRALVISHFIDHALNRALYRRRGTSRALTRTRNISRAITRIRTISRALANEIARSLEYASTRAIDFDSNLANELTDKYSLAITLSKDISRTRSIDDAYNLAIKRAPHITYNLNRDSANDLEVELASRLDFVNNLSFDLDRSIKIILSIFTLQERIAGRSPAFEGIRLVKERTKP
jgi:hypothetical protein